MRFTQNLKKIIPGHDLDQDSSAAILKGGKGPKRDIVVLNSGAALVAAEMADNIKNGIVLAEQSIDSGRAVEKLELLVQYTQENG